MMPNGIISRYQINALSGLAKQGIFVRTQYFEPFVSSYKPEIITVSPGF